MKTKLEFPKANKPIKRHGADYLRRIVEWLNNRPEYLNDNKSHLELIGEYNKERQGII